MNDVVATAVLGGKTARACDSCLVKRARWFCPGDDAFLCQACDTSVHSASQLASRHMRVRLQTSSFCKTRPGGSDPLSPAWHQGFTRKARTPRQAKGPIRLGGLANQHVVPEMGSSEDPFVEESEDPEQLFCRVPVFDAFAEELVKGGGGFDIDEEIGGVIFENDLNVKELLSNCGEGFLGNVDEFSYVKVEEKDDEEVKDVIACHFDDVELNWDFDSLVNKEEEEEMKMEMEMEMENESGMLLRLNYEEVIAAWDTQGSPWTDGIRPQFNLDEFMVPCLGEISHEWGDRTNIAGREARVSRYREKRRKRLFSKKIRYEVRKLNADKRPRMKGRFVKRTAFSGSYQLMNK